MSVATLTVTMETYSEIGKTEELDLAEERKIVLRCQKGDADAMGTLIIRYQHWVYNIAYGMLSHHQDAEDVAQDAFISAWENIEKFQFRSRFSTWLYRIVKNKCLNHIDQYQRRKTDPTEIDDSQPWVPLDTVTPEEDALRTEEKEIVHAALAKLKDSHREILVLRELRDMAYEEIAEVLGCTLGRVKSRLHEARKALKKELERVEW